MQIYKHSSTAATHRLAVLRHTETVHPRRSAVLGLSSQAPLRKRVPEQALVGTARERLVGIHNRVPSADKRRVAGLQRHTVEHQLHGQVPSVGRDAVAVELGRGGGVAAVLVNQRPQDLVQNRGPHGADGVDGVERVDGRVDERVGRVAGRVGVRADTRRPARRPLAHGVVSSTRVVGLDADGGGVEVAPALAHAAGLEQAQAVRVAGPARQALRQPVRVLVDDDAGLEGAVAVGRRRVPDVHAHASRGAVGPGREVCVVEARAVLCVEPDEVVAHAALAVVVGLEVACGRGEAELVEEVVVGVGGVPELGDGCVDVAAEVGGVEAVGVVEVEGWAGGAREAEVFGLRAVGPVVLRDGVVAAGGVVGVGAIAVPGELAGF